MRSIAAVLLIAATTFPRPGHAAATAARILDAIAKARVERDGAVEKLYGVVINGKDTDHGRLACARVVAIILNRAGVGISRSLLSVRSVEAALQSWKRVDHQGEVRAGDVVVYSSPFNRSAACTGNGACHVVIATGSSRLYGNVSISIPPFVSKGPTTHWVWWLRAAGFRFKAAYRPPR